MSNLRFYQHTLGRSPQASGASAVPQSRTAALPVPLFSVFDATSTDDADVQPPAGPCARLQPFAKVRAATACCSHSMIVVHVLRHEFVCLIGWTM